MQGLEPKAKAHCISATPAHWLRCPMGGQASLHLLRPLHPEGGLLPVPGHCTASPSPAAHGGGCCWIASSGLICMCSQHPLSPDVLDQVAMLGVHPLTQDLTCWLPHLVGREGHLSGSSRIQGLIAQVLGPAWVGSYPSSLISLAGGPLQASEPRTLMEVIGRRHQGQV